VARPDAPADDRPTDTPRQMDYTDDAQEGTDTETAPPQTLDQLSDELERRADAAELLAQPGSGGRRSHAYQAGKVAGFREAVSAVRALAQRQAGDDSPDRSDDVELITDGGLEVDVAAGEAIVAGTRHWVGATTLTLATADPDDLIGRRVRVEGIEATREVAIIEVIDPDDTPAAQVDRGIRYQTDDGETLLCYPARQHWDIEVLTPATDGGDA